MGRNHLKSALFWNRFVKSGSLQAYLRFRQASHDESSSLSASKDLKLSSAKRNAAKSKLAVKGR